MQNIHIETPLNVNVKIQHAGIGLRFLAFAIDIFIIIGYILLTNWIFTKLGVSSVENDNHEFVFDLQQFKGILFNILLFPALFYSLWTESVFNGQTIGKMICKIRVVKLNGYHAGFSEYFTRWVFRFVDFWTASFVSIFLFPIFGTQIASIITGMLALGSGLVAVISISKTKNSQRIGDIVAGTTVLKLKDKESLDITILEEIQESYVPIYSQVMRLSDNDARIIKDTFTVARKNGDFATLKKLRNKLESVMEVEGNGGDIEFIETVMKDFNYYTQKL